MASLVDVPVLSTAGGATVALGAMEPEGALPPGVSGRCTNHLLRHLDSAVRMEGGTFGRSPVPGEGPYGLG